MIVQRIDPREAIPWIMNRHYAHRRCPISYAFGLVDCGSLVGIVTYGTPASPPLRAGVCGPEWASAVLELNRLCVGGGKNRCSILVGRSLRLLPKPSIVVSYADVAVGHVGYVYQASNFIYTGLSAKRSDWSVAGMEHLHGVTVADESRGEINRAQWMRDKHGDKFHLRERSRKHRYVFFCGSAKQKSQMRKSLRYSECPYPKGDSVRHDDTKEVTTQRRLWMD